MPEFGRSKDTKHNEHKTQRSDLIYVHKSIDDAIACKIITNWHLVSLDVYYGIRIEHNQLGLRFDVVCGGDQSITLLENGRQLDTHFTNKKQIVPELIARLSAIDRFDASLMLMDTKTVITHTPEVVKHISVLGYLQYIVTIVIVEAGIEFLHIKKSVDEFIEGRKY